MPDNRGTRLGLARGDVRLEPSNRVWARDARRLIRLIDRALGRAAVAVEHVGSTAVPGLVSKPIIDVAVGVGPDADVSGLVGALEGVGLVYRGDKGSNGGLLFVLEDQPARRLAHVHVVRHGYEQWVNYLAVRKRLREDAGAREAYAGLKVRLAAQFPTNRGAYTSGKVAFISHLLDPVGERSTSP